jgi:hypothetical protein
MRATVFYCICDHIVRRSTDDERERERERPERKCKGRTRKGYAMVVPFPPKKKVPECVGGMLTWSP